MTKEQIIQSGFTTAFLNEYFEDKIHSFYPDKDSLLYILCNSEQEKKEVTIKQIEITKAKISELGFEDLSFAYLLSCKPESLHNYIEPNKRFDFWMQRFSEDFEENITDFDPITKAIHLFNEVSELTVEVMANEIEFWEWYPQSQRPKIADFISIIPNEAELLSLIEYDIQEYDKNEYWEFDFEEYKRFIEVSKPIEILFNLSELLVQLSRLQMFNEFLEIENEALSPPPIKTKADILKEQLSQYSFFELEKVKILSEQSKVSIIEKISESGLPYAIAMFDYLKFIPYLEKKHFNSKYNLNREVSKWFNSDKDGRAVKGNISSLLKNTTENKTRYTAHKHKEKVIKDYELLK